MTLKKNKPEENLYYLLATVYGEQSEKNSFDGTYEGKNRRIWNAIMGQWLSEKSKQALARDLCIDAGEFSELTQHEISAVERRLSGTGFSTDDILDETTTHLFHVVQFRDIHFPTGLLMQKRVFPTTVTFINCTFSGSISLSDSLFSAAHFKKCEFQKNAYFRQSKIGVLGWVSNACEFTECNFLGHCEFSEAQLRSADFTKSTFKTAAHFEDTVFYSGCPKFFETELPEDTLFTLKNENWGLPFTRLKKDGKFEDYTKADIDRESVKYAALRKRMESIQRPVEAGFL